MILHGFILSLGVILAFIFVPLVVLALNGISALARILKRIWPFGKSENRKVSCPATTTEFAASVTV